MHYFYILRCSDGSLYCGQTNNLKKRVREHNLSKFRSAKYTKSRRPVALVYSEEHANKSLAMQREWEVKTWPKAQKEVLVKGDSEDN